MIEQIEYSNIRPNPFQPKTRWPINPISVRELADDIHANGLIHKPVGRRTTNGTVEIGVGHRRVTAWVIAFPGQPLPMDIQELNDRQMYDYMISEGAHRLDWTALEKGERLADYMSRFGVSQTEAAKRFNLSQGAASNLIRLARDLPADVKPLVTSRALPERFARQIVTLARIDNKASVKVAQTIAQADESERERIAQSEVAEFLEHKAQSLENLAWPADWKPDHSIMIERQMETPTACQGCPAVETAMQTDYCTRLACFEAKLFLWQQRELNRLSDKFSVQVATKGETVHVIEIDYNNEGAARAFLADKKAGRDHLRLMPTDLGKNKHNYLYYHKTILGSNQASLGSTDKAFVIQRNEPNKASGASKKAPPDDKTPAQKAAREKREERERQSRREEKAALRRAKVDVCWLLTNTAERVAPDMKVSGGVLDYCYERMKTQGYFNHQDWGEYIVFENDLRSKIDASTGDVREDRIRLAILLGQMRRDIASYRPEDEFDVARDIAIISQTIGKTFRLALPKGWHDIPVHTTDSNCHICGKFTSLDHITQVDQAAGWKNENGLVTCSDDCRARVIPAQPKSKPTKTRTAKQRRADYLKSINVVKKGRR